MTSPAAEVPVLPFKRIKRDDETLRARRNSVSKSNVVGNDVNSTGRTRYSDTISTVTEAMISVTISRSRTKPGSGVISATTMANTASGTASSLSALSGTAANIFEILGAASALAGLIHQPGNFPF